MAAERASVEDDDLDQCAVHQRAELRSTLPAAAAQEEELSARNADRACGEVRISLSGDL
jgi:hypothetical protein